MTSLNALFLLGSLLSYNSVHAYTLTRTYDYTNFLDADSFSWYDGWDTFNKGLTLYTSRAEAMSSGLAKITADNKVYLGVDTTNKLTSTTPGASNGRKSIRLSSNQTIDNGLLIADIEHMPATGCGAWPTYWLLRDSGPNYNEIDIIEGLTPWTSTEMNIWTNTVPVCTIKDLGGTTATYGTNCLSTTGGCHAATSANSFGQPFNNGQGGFWATQIESTGVKIWYFPRGTQPADLQGSNPNPAAWPKPMMNFGAVNCNMTQALSKMSITINTVFCGTWASPAWASGTGCAAATRVSTCEAYVANNPGAFTDAYWLFNSIKLYQMNVPTITTSSAKPTPTLVSSSTLQSPSASTLKTITKAAAAAATTTDADATTSQTTAAAADPGNNNPTTPNDTNPTTPNTSSGMTTNAQCGGTSGNTCTGSQWGNCCSSWGWCGSSDLYCGAGCQSQFGTCN